MTKITYSPDFPEGKIEEHTAEELAQKETEKANDITNAETEETAKQAQADLKASAKTKLMAGEPLTEEEADVMLGG